MGFFDLNIPYHESDKHIANKSSLKISRLKLIVKAMELGYSGVAYNRTIKGVMSESDRCATPLFPLSSVLKVAPSLSYAVELHRGLLGVPASAPFRQYTRLTVVVDSSSQASALNSGNPILKTYDIVAVRPMNQNAFEQACQASEVDLISIDFSEKLPFRLKQQMVKAAIERGVHFEITYSALLMDVQLRRQMISSAKLLVGWTRGKNLIISSAAPSVTEIRGPYDVANLFLLLGLSIEHAKAALSKNCSSLIVKALRKKHYYKEAIRVEIAPSGKEFNSKEPAQSGWMKWDPLSSGEGDLLIEDLSKSFSATNSVAKTVNSIDFASVMDNPSSDGLQFQVFKPLAKASVQPLETEKPNANAVSGPLEVSFLNLSKTSGTLSHSNPSQHLAYITEDPVGSISPTCAQRNLSEDDKNVMHTVGEEVCKSSDGFGVHVAPFESKMLYLQSQNCIKKSDTQVGIQDSSVTVEISPMDTGTVAHEAVSDAENFTRSADNDFPVFNRFEYGTSSHSDAALGSQDDEKKLVLTDMNKEVEADLALATSESDDIRKGQFGGMRGVPNAMTEVSLAAVSCNEAKEKSDDAAKNGVLIMTNAEDEGDLSNTLCESNGRENHQLRRTEDASILLPGLVSQVTIHGSSNHTEQVDEVAMREQKEIEDHVQSYSSAVNGSSGKRKIKPRRPNQGVVFPLKHLLNRRLFKRKAQKPKIKTKLR